MLKLSRFYCIQKWAKHYEIMQTFTTFWEDVSKIQVTDPKLGFESLTWKFLKIFLDLHQRAKFRQLSLKVNTHRRPSNVISESKILRKVDFDGCLFRFPFKWHRFSRHIWAQLNASRCALMVSSNLWKDLHISLCYLSQWLMADHLRSREN